MPLAGIMTSDFQSFRGLARRRLTGRGLPWLAIPDVGLAGDQPPRSQICLDPLNELWKAHRAWLARYWVPTLENRQRRDASNSVTLRKHQILFSVDLS